MRTGLVLSMSVATAMLATAQAATALPVPPEHEHKHRTAAVAATAVANNNPAFLQVYNNNIENLPTVGLQCPGDWQDLVYYMKLQTYKPDIFIVQQISNQSQLNSYVSRLSSDFGESYGAVIAETNPAAMNSPCGAPKDYQTNAVIYRKARFTLLSDPDASTKRWQAQADNGNGCENNDQARTKAVKVKLQDKVAGKVVTAASAHWATAASGGPPCAPGNAKEVSDEMREDGYGGSLLIFGMDANITDLDGSTYRSWYSALNGDRGGSYGYRDVVYSQCSGGLSCLSANWTIGGNRRIDFIFAQRGDRTRPAVSDVHTITWDEGDAADNAVTGSDREDMDYSDHRAIRARIYY